MSNKSSLPRVLMLDLDGTLVDSEPLYATAWKSLLNPCGIDAYRRFAKGLREYDALAALRPYLRDPTQSDAEVLKRKRDAFNRFLIEIRESPLPGVNELLTTVHASGVPMIVVTNSDAWTAKRLLVRANIDAFIADTICWQPGRAPKPNPELYLLAIARAEVGRQDILVIEDSWPGILAARAAGLRVCCVNGDGSTSAECHANDVPQFMTAYELLDWLRSLGHNTSWPPDDDLS